MSLLIRIYVFSTNVQCWNVVWARDVFSFILDLVPGWQNIQILMLTHLLSNILSVTVIFY